MQRKFFWLAPLAICTLATGIAQATDGTANATVIQPLVLTSGLDLDFGRISPTGLAGTVVVDTADGRTLTNVNDEGGTVTSGAWSVTGEPLLVYDITLPSTDVTLTGSVSGTMVVNTFVDSKTGAGTISGGGTDSFTVGATLNVGGTQASGTYTGTYTVTVAYQ